MECTDSCCQQNFRFVGKDLWEATKSNFGRPFSQSSFKGRQSYSHNHVGSHSRGVQKPSVWEWWFATSAFQQAEGQCAWKQTPGSFCTCTACCGGFVVAPQATLSSSASLRQGTSCLSYVGLLKLVFKPSTINTQAKINFLGNLGKGRQFWKDLL